jgi:hypothetical protein
MSVMPYRMPAPPEPEDRPDADELAYARRLERLRATSRLRVAAFAMILLAAAAVLVARSARPRPVFPSLRAKVASSLAAANATRARSEEAHHSFVSAIQSAAAEAPTDCAQRARLVSRIAPREHVPVVLVREEDVATGAFARPRVSRGFGSSQHAFVVVAKTLAVPRVTGASSYEPGSLEGRVLVYDSLRGSVICSSELRAQSSTSIGYGYAHGDGAPAWLGRSASLQSSLDADFDAEVEQAIRHSLGVR